jgi:hypothetical protein
MSGGEILVGALLVVGAVAIIAKTAFREGYRRGQQDLLHPRTPTAAERKSALMRRTLPLWRRVGGWAAVAIGSMSVWFYLWLASRQGSGWAYVGALLASLISLMAGMLLMEWIWKPFRDAQARVRARKRDAEDTRP